MKVVAKIKEEYTKSLINRDKNKQIIANRDV